MRPLCLAKLQRQAASSAGRSFRRTVLVGAGHRLRQPPLFGVVVDAPSMSFQSKLPSRGGIAWALVYPPTDVWHRFSLLSSHPVPL